jgi:spore coat polysaccharide biosynthesis protein SpsF
LATSNHPPDNKFNDLFKNKRVLIFRGPLQNVYLRYLKLIKKYKLKYFLRVSGDSPLIDYRIIDRAYKIFKKKNMK